MNKKETTQKDYITPTLFCVCIALVFVFLIVSVALQRPNYLSVSYGATASEVEEYAYSLLELDDPGEETAEHYLEALSYYDSQITTSKNDEQRFNLQLGLASLLGKTGDPASGLEVLDEIDISKIPLDAKYYLYSTYAYLYQRGGKEQEATEYLERISDEGIYDYIAKLDSGEIDPDEFEKEMAESAEEEVNEEAVESDDDIVDEIVEEGEVNE